MCLAKDFSNLIWRICASGHKCSNGLAMVEHGRTWNAHVASHSFTSCCSKSFQLQIQIASLALQIRSNLIQKALGGFRGSDASTSSMRWQKLCAVGSYYELLSSAWKRMIHHDSGTLVQTRRSFSTVHMFQRLVNMFSFSYWGHTYCRFIDMTRA